MAISFNKVVTNSTPASPLAIDPAATANDVLISGEVCDFTDSSTFSITAFDAIARQETTTDAQNLGVNRKKAATGSEGSLNITNSAARAMIGFILALTGADNTTPEDVTTVVVNNNTGAASPATLTANITPVTDGCMIVAIMGTDTTASVNATTTFSTTSGTTGAWTTRADLNSGFNNIAVGTALQTTAGAITVQGSSSFASGTAGRAMIVMAIRPGAGGAAAFSLNAEPGSFTVTGAAAGVLAARILSADPGVLVITGSDAGVLAARILAADPGAYVVTGAEASLIRDAVMNAQPGAFSVSGADADLDFSGEQAVIVMPYKLFRLRRGR